MAETALLWDLGGTNSRIALARGGTMTGARRLSLRNDSAADFPAMLRQALDRLGGPRPEAVAIALAAPITGDRLKLTNRDWTLDRAEIAEVTGARRVLFLNDFQALAMALSDPAALAPRALQAGQPDGHAPAIVLGAGTGFNSAVRLPSGGIVTAETGHTTFAAVTPFDTRLRDAISAGHGRCSVERVLSGPGLASIHAQLSREAGHPIHPDRPEAILSRGLAGTDALAAEAAEVLARVYGRVAGDLALSSLAFGGVWLNGGPSRAMAPLLADPDGPFLTAFRAKGRMSHLMPRFPVRLIEEDGAALVGCLAALRDTPA